MPTARGIKVNIISQWELRVHPEFPHPDCSQYDNHHTASAYDSDGSEEHSIRQEATSTSNRNDILQQGASVSVYTPSVPGAKFWITWLITEPATELSQWFYFKLYLNGRHVTSWGTDCYKQPKGQVMRGLFEPSERWNYKSAGIVYKNMGTESRPFIFTQKNHTGTAATDGGVMEVRVFRALGRRRKMPEPTDFKSQDLYGIAMPSGGLLEKPEEAKFYDWHLSDPLDEPFATIKFHYRSWSSLHELSLIPEDHPRELLSPTPSIRSVLGQTDRSQLLLDEQAVEGVNNDEYDGLGDTDDEEEYDDWEDDYGPSVAAPTHRHDSIASDSAESPWLTTVFDEDDEALAECERRSSAGLKYDNAPINPDPRKINLASRSTSLRSETATSGPIRQPKRVKRRSILDRPLPEIPYRSSSMKTSHSRRSSSVSPATSITPSLRSYIERGEASSPEPSLSTARVASLPEAVVHAGHAKLVDVTPPKCKSDGTAQELSPPLTSPEASPPETDIRQGKYTPPARVSSAAHNPKPLEKSPLSDLFQSPNAMNITVRKHKRTPGNFLARLSISGSPFKNGSPFRSNSFSKGTDSENHSPDRSTLTPSISMNTTLSEGEWIGRTPSPQKPRDDGRYGNMWSPSLGENGKHRTRRDTESSTKKSFWRDSPAVDNGDYGHNEPKDGVDTAEKVANTSRERLTMKAMEWYENVRASKEDARDDRAGPKHTLNNNDVKTRYGWI